jgi:beta-lactamase regulating signal transducer with metallopeptidase domain
MIFSCTWIGELLREAAQGLLMVSLISGVVVIVSLLVHRCFRKWFSPSFLYLFWILVVARFVLFAVPESPTSFLNLIVDRDPNQQVSSTLQPGSQLPENFWNGAETNVEIAASESTKLTSGLPFDWDMNAILGVVWILGFAFLGFRLIIGYRKVQSLIRSSNKPTVQLQRKFERLKQRIGVKQRVQLCLTDQTDLPGMVGVFRPRLCPLIGISIKNDT